jgi:hypothetical protein
MRKYLWKRSVELDKESGIQYSQDVHLVPHVSVVALPESTVLCVLIHDPPVLSISGYSFTRPTLHTSGIHAVRRLKVV